MIKFRGLAGIWVKRSNIWTFIAIALCASQAQIIGPILSSVLDGNDMVNLESDQSIIFT